MKNFFVAIIWTLITSVLLKYSIYFSFNYDIGISGAITSSITILWLTAFLKSGGKMQ